MILQHEECLIMTAMYWCFFIRCIRCAWEIMYQIPRLDKDVTSDSRELSKKLREDITVRHKQRKWYKRVYPKARSEGNPSLLSLKSECDEHIYNKCLKNVCVSNSSTTVSVWRYCKHHNITPVNDVRQIEQTRNLSKRTCSLLACHCMALHCMAQHRIL